MFRWLPQPPDDITVYLVLIDRGKNGIAYDETDPDEADLETTIRNFLTGRYDALRVMAFNAAEGWSQDVSEDIAQELLQRAINAGDDLGEGAQRFVDRHVITARVAGATGRDQSSTVSRRILRSGHRHTR